MQRNFPGNAALMKGGHLTALFYGVFRSCTFRSNIAQIGVYLHEGAGQVVFKLAELI